MRIISILWVALGSLATLPGTAMGGAFSIIDGDSITTDPHKSKVEVVAVDGKLRPGRVVRVEPGTRLFVLTSTRRTSSKLRSRLDVVLDMQPCKRYIVSADHGTALELEWKLNVERIEPIAGCDPADLSPPPKAEPKRYFEFDQELSMLGDRAAAHLLASRCAEFAGDEERGRKAIERWESFNGAHVAVVEERLKYFVIARGLLGGFDASVDTLTRFEEAIGARRDAVVAEALGEGALTERCPLALADLEKRVAIYDRSLKALNAVKAARRSNDKERAQNAPLVAKNWDILVEEAAVPSAYWVAAEPGAGER